MKFKKALSLFMTAVLLSSSVPLNVFAQENGDENAIITEDTIVSGSALTVLNDGIEVEFNVISSWNSGYNAEIIIKNNGTNIVENWALELELPDEITNIWNANIKQHKDIKYLIKNDEWNKNIDIGEKVSFGISCQSDGIVNKPNGFAVISESKETSEEDYSIDFKVLSDWESGYTAQIVITNNLPISIEGWHLEFDYNKPIDSIWNATIESVENEHYQLCNNGYNANIGAGQSITIGFMGSEGNIHDVPTNYFLTQYGDDIQSLIEITVDTDDFSRNEVADIYYVDEIINKLTGKITYPETIKSFKYEISDIANNVVKTGVIDVSENWEIDDFGLTLGANYLKLIAVTKNNHNINKEIVLFNTILDNMEHIDVDTNDDDGDLINNYYESIYGTNPLKADTDDDLISDLYEIILLGTDPTLPDSDGDDINDGDEDFDLDNVTNLQEIENGTNPFLPDTDDDKLNDGDELYKYNTDPLNPDSDDDNLKDGTEVKLGLDPNNEDSDNNHISDGTELIPQTYSKEIQNESLPAITEVSVDLSCSGDIEDSVFIQDIYNIDLRSSDVVGIKGSPVDISVDAEFDTAKITFKYDETKLNGTPEENLCVMWYDEENDNYILLEDSVVDTDNNTVSYVTNHFSRYLVVDRKIWLDVWREDINYRTSGDVTYYDIAFVVDTSGSMGGSRIQLSQQALNTFIDAMMTGDRGSIIKFNSYATTVQGLTSDKSKLSEKVSSLNASGGTNANNGIIYGINQLLSTEKPQERMLILICDGDVNYYESTIKKAIDNNITIHCVNVASGSSIIMKTIAEQTGGMYYYAATSNDIAEVLSKLQGDTIDHVDITDSDGDGLYDIYETNGMRISNGQIVYTDPNKKESYIDGINDFDAMGGLPVVENYYIDGNTYACTLNHAVVYGGLSPDFIYVDGKPNKNGFGTINEKMDFVPYSYYYINKTYNPNSDAENKVAVSFKSENWGTKKVDGDAGVNGCFSDKLTEKNVADLIAYDTVNTLTIEALIKPLETNDNFPDLLSMSIKGDSIGYPATECFRVYVAGNGGEEKGLLNGTRKYIDAEFVTRSKLFNSNSGNVYFKENMASILEVAETTLNKYNTEMYISLSPNKVWRGSLYHNTTSIFSVESITAISNVTAFGTFNNSDAAITAHCTYNPNNEKYTVEYTYYLIDFYDFTFDERLFKLDALGLAKAYELYGMVSGKVSWKKGDKFIFYLNN